MSPIPEQSKFRTPSVTDSTGGAISEDQARERGRMVKTAEGSDLLPTPTVFHLTMHDEPIEKFLEREQRSSTGQIGKSLGVALRMEIETVSDTDNKGS